MLCRTNRQLILGGVITAALSQFILPVSCMAGSDEVILLNNQGVTLLNAMSYSAAIEKFEAALKIDPNYNRARENLAIALNNAALKADVNGALKFLHKSLFVNPSNATTLQNLEALIREGMKLDPQV